jgi:hypothetical protein
VRDQVICFYKQAVGEQGCFFRRIEFYDEVHDRLMPLSYGYISRKINQKNANCENPILETYARDSSARLLCYDPTCFGDLSLLLKRFSSPLDTINGTRPMVSLH